LQRPPPFLLGTDLFGSGHQDVAWRYVLRLFPGIVDDGGRSGSVLLFGPFRFVNEVLGQAVHVGFVVRRTEPHLIVVV
jgi:hypothetical protein